MITTIFVISITLQFYFWCQAVRYIEYDSSFSDDEKQQARVLKITCNLNDAACKLKLKKYKEAEKLCTKVTFADKTKLISQVSDSAGFFAST